MRKVIVSNIVSLDGYYAGPGGNPLVLPMDHVFNAENLERIQAADLVLLGRASYEMFSSYWPHVAEAPADPGNPALDDTNRSFSRVYNGLPKAVVSDTFTPADDNPWRDRTTVVPRDDVAGWIAKQRAGGDGDLVVFGSHLMWNGLLEQGLVDELHLMVGAVVLGAGVPLFTGPVDGLTLLDTRRFEGSGTVLLRYAARRTP